MIHLFHAKRVELELDWNNKHVRYMIVAVLSGVLNVVTYVIVSSYTDFNIARFCAVIAGGTLGYLGHEFVSYGYGKQLTPLTVVKFGWGMINNVGVYYVVAWILGHVLGFLPYLVTHIATMCIGFLFFQQWNLRVTFKAQVIKPESADGPAVIHVELSDE